MTVVRETFHQQVRQNKVRSILLMGAVVVILAVLSGFVGFYFGSTPVESRIFLARVLPIPKMYVKATSPRLSFGRSTPAIRATRVSSSCRRQAALLGGLAASNLASACAAG